MSLGPLLLETLSTNNPGFADQDPKIYKTKYKYMWQTTEILHPFLVKHIKW